MKPRMFIGSSVERLDLAYAAQENLEYDVESTVWTQGVFAPSRTTMVSLINELNKTHFGLFIFAPDDTTQMRDGAHNTVRDNVILELGLFIGRLGTDRCFLVVPRGVKDLHLPTDLLGLVPATFIPERQDGNMVAALGPACNSIRKLVAQLGPATLTEPTLSTSGEPCDDPEDCIAILESWLGRRTESENTAALRYDDIDHELRLAPGSARLYLEKAAVKWKYVVTRKGRTTVRLDSVRL